MLKLVLFVTMLSYACAAPGLVATTHVVAPVVAHPVVPVVKAVPIVHAAPIVPLVKTVHYPAPIVHHPVIPVVKTVHPVIVH